jgi:secondary thiamine-phosphate synthase enzyme
MEIKIKSSEREEIIDITKEISGLVNENSRRSNKMCLVYVPHSTCSVIINENHDSAVKQDILKFFRKQIPAGIWKHDEVDNNADAHIKASIIGPSQIIPIKNKKLQLGSWQGIGLAEFDGPRERKVIVEVI